jgi:hypothetical protein
MGRVARLLLLFAIMVGIALDPYSWHRTASDATIGAPWWQITGAVLALILGACAAAFIWRDHRSRAAVLLLIETLLSLAWSALLVRRDGMSRFVRGFGAEEFLSVYLVLLACRVLLLYSLLAPDSAERSNAKRERRGGSGQIAV